MSRLVKVPHICPPPLPTEPDYEDPLHQKELLSGKKLYRCIITECSRTEWLPVHRTDFIFSDRMFGSDVIFGCIEIPEEDLKWRLEEIEQISNKRFDDYWDLLEDPS